MNFLAIDTDADALKQLSSAINRVCSDASVISRTHPVDALHSAEDQLFDVVFLETELDSVNGLALASRLREIQPGLHIIFVTDHEKYALDAFAIHADGYLMKPVSEDDIRRELNYLYGTERKTGAQIRVQTFGGFEVFANERPVVFKRSKSKELLAYLINRRGAGITTREACDILFDDGIYNTSRKNYFQTILSDLRSSLKKAGIEHILIRRHNHLSIDISSFTCDYYQFLEGSPAAISRYRHDYLPSYSWAELTLGSLDAQVYSSLT